MSLSFPFHFISFLYPSNIHFSFPIFSPLSNWIPLYPSPSLSLFLSFSFPSSSTLYLLLCISFTISSLYNSFCLSSFPSLNLSLSVFSQLLSISFDKFCPSLFILVFVSVSLFILPFYICFSIFSISLFLYICQSLSPFLSVYLDLILSFITECVLSPHAIKTLRSCILFIFIHIRYTTHLETRLKCLANLRLLRWDGPTTINTIASTEPLPHQQVPCGAL